MSRSLYRFALPIASALFALVAIEVGLRVLAASREPRDVAKRYHPRLGWEKVPKSTRVEDNGEFRLRTARNDRGLRGLLVPYTKPRSEYRVFMLGDSFLEGYTVPDDELVSALVAQLAGVTTINAGTGGYSTDQELLFYRDEGRKYAPDLVVLLFYDNDAWINTQREYFQGPQKPLFVEGATGLQLTNVPVPQPSSAAPRGQSSRSVRQWLHDNSQLYLLLAGRLKAIPAVRRAGLSGGWIAPEWLPPHYQVYQRDPNHAVEQAWRLTARLLETLRDETQADGADFVVFSVPNAGAVDDGIWERTLLKYDLDPDEWDSRMVESTLGNICQLLGVEFIPAIDRFRAESAELYYPRDQHWNAAGHKLAAEMISEQIARHR